MKPLLLGSTILGAAMLLSAPAPTLPHRSPERSEGAASCASTVCHGSLTPWKESRVLQNEYVTWTRQDKHAQAYSVLRNEASKKIARNLRLGKAAWESPVCLECHTHFVPQKSRSERFVLSDGVTCEACHGPAGKYLAAHDDAGRTHEQNLADGLYPLEDPAARAKLCLSCHGTNGDRFVTHRMLSAGHPRISFELQTFSMIQPAHFATSLSEHPRAKPWNGARIWAVGQAVAVSEQMSLLGNAARNHDGPFPELALFDCNACHHEMSDKRWKPQAAFGETPPPGVVRLNEANILLLRLIAQQMDVDLGKRLTERAAALQAANAGDGDLQQAAKQMKDAADDVQVRLRSFTFSGPVMSGLASSIIDAGTAGHFLDYASAEQAFMSLGSIVDFMNRSGSLADAEGANASLAALAETLKSDESWSATEFQKRIGSLRKALREK